EHAVVTHFIGNQRDITEHKRAREENCGLEEKIRETQKLESLGVLAGGIAHDFNNLLTTVIGYAHLAAAELPPASPLQEYMREIDNAGRPAATLCQQMLAYAGKGRYVIEPVDLNGLLRDTLALLQASIAKQARLQLQLEAQLPPIQADSAQMRQVI